MLMSSRFARPGHKYSFPARNTLMNTEKADLDPENIIPPSKSSAIPENNAGVSILGQQTECHSDQEPTVPLTRNSRSTTNEVLRVRSSWTVMVKLAHEI
jgi:hypothetical protein